MCFDDQVLSAYYDGELEGVWKDRVKEHLETCSVCSSKISSFGRTGRFLSSAALSEKDYRQDEVWERIRRTISTENELGFWSRRVSVVKAAGTAAAVFVIVLGISLFIVENSGMKGGNPVAEISPIFSHSTSEVLQTDGTGRFVEFLRTREDPSELYIELPVNRNFRYLGEPQFLREADFVRGR